ncbi:DUF4382 domain-containing protein [Flammeovirga kamogawensis]|uniref:DUF4382 domain-containing protein n=1 Tax=Flammeovirga kamogawensis TaxID=373891 RepID=A0ABX8H1F5_9BACT|nr:DUF4382 domain-containing protein [Flammeovirga kamogawensis]MBB6462401.1 hypothetical protein [Flammeovirga kamogawensis]QWG09514.1 DUF4382 domain-containing protein [Flammeovirga kamogawensis]TRX65030.1 DUF4382 domain-containing protein [Flammeovirga kamogawensis]
MKNFLIALASTAVLATSCSQTNDSDSNYIPATTADISLQATGLDTNTSTYGAGNGLDGVDSVVVGITSFHLSINGDTVTFEKVGNEGSIDLLSFTSTDTLIWTNEEIPSGDVGDVATLYLDKNYDNNYVIESDGNKADLHLSHTALDFRLVSDEDDFDEGNKYVIKLNMSNSLRLVSKGNGSYNLQQGTAGTEKMGTMVLVETVDNDIDTDDDENDDD